MEEEDAMEEDKALVVWPADDRRDDMEKVVELVDCRSHGEVSSPRPRSIFYILSTLLIDSLLWMLY